MAYKHKYVTGEDYAFYNNSDDLESNANFNYWVFSLVHADTHIVVSGDITTLSKDIISGSDYRWYADAFEFPAVNIGCYKFIIEDTISGNILYISNEIDVVDSTDGLMFCRYRNAKNILNYNYEVLTSFYNQFHVELKKRKPVLNEDTEGYGLTNGSFKRVRTTLTKTFEFVTGWFDEEEHDATHEMAVHSDFNIVFGGNFNSMTKTEDSEYDTDWQEDYEFIQTAFRLEQDSKSSSNKAL